MTMQRITGLLMEQKMKLDPIGFYIKRFEFNILNLSIKRSNFIKK